MNIAEILLQRAEELRDAAVLVDVYQGKDRSISYGELDRATSRVAHQLRKAGLRQGDGVLLLHPVAAELYIFLIALFRLGCIAIFLDPSAGRAHIGRCCEIFQPKAFFGSRRAQLLRLIMPALRRVPKAFCFDWFPGTLRLDYKNDNNFSPEIAAASAEAPALVTFTSGSTGQPKAASRSHGFLLAQHRALEPSLDLRPRGRDLTTLPIFVLANLASGVTSILPDADLRAVGKIDAKPVLAQLRRTQPQTTAASPAFMQRLLDECEKTGTQMPELQKVFLGGAPVFPDLLRRAKQFCPRAAITAVYGSTEAEPMAEIALADISNGDFQRMEQGKGLLTGRPTSAISLFVIRDQWGTQIGHLDAQQFEQMQMETDEAGEIVVSGAHVLPGYIGGMGDAETKFEVEGKRWHRTGDLGYMDSQGRLWLLGRASAKIQDERGTLYPFAVECAAMKNSEIQRVAVVSAAGRRVLAVEAKTKLPPEIIMKSLEWAHLDQVIFIDRLPVDKRHNAKIDYVALTKMLNAL